MNIEHKVLAWIVVKFQPGTYRAVRKHKFIVTMEEQDVNEFRYRVLAEERTSLTTRTSRRRTREGAIAMDKTKAADKARRIAENLSGYAADFHGLERSIRNGKSDASDMAYELETLIDELEALTDELEWALKDIRER